MDNITLERQKDLTEERRDILKERRKREEKELEDESKRTHIKDSERMGRKTGSIEWRTSRGEAGKSLVNSLLEKRKDGKYIFFNTIFYAHEHKNNDSCLFYYYLYASLYACIYVY